MEPRDYRTEVVGSDLDAFLDSFRISRSDLCRQYRDIDYLETLSYWEIHQEVFSHSDEHLEVLHAA